MNYSIKNPEYISKVLTEQFGYTSEQAEPLTEVLLEEANKGTFKSCRDLKEYIYFNL